MNKKDLFLILAIIILVLTILIIRNYLLPNNRPTTAYIYYQNELIKTISLDKKALYEVEGALGPITIETNLGEVRVAKETSPRNLCSKQGWIKVAPSAIVCLPNKVIINVAGNSNLDAVVE